MTFLECSATLALLCTFSSMLHAQNAEADPRTVLAPGLRKLTGLEPTQQIQYARIFLDGRPITVGSAPNTTETLLRDDERPPVLIAQCTRRNGKLRFELFANYGKVSDFTYHPPWRSTGPNDNFPPRTEKVQVIFNFYGYINWKPIRRQWEMQIDPAGEMRYNPPSTGSSNMEEVSFYMQYLKPLPTMRLTMGNTAAQFETAAWAKAVHDEPLCAASGL